MYLTGSGKMFDLVSVGTHTYYIDFPSRIGIYKPDDTDAVYLIDSGNDTRIAKRVLKIINERGWSLKAIFNTHCHADHVGGNAYLQEHTGCSIYVPDIDCGAVGNPILNPVMLYGAYPTKELTRKFYMAEKSEAKPLSQAQLPEGLEWYPLCGHTMGMVGFKTVDNVWFIADSIVSAEVLKKYTVTYLIDVEQYLSSLSYLETLESGIFVPSHCEPTRDIKVLARLNKEYVGNIISEILELCSEPRLCDDIIKHFFDNNKLGFNMMQYALIGSTVRSYLSYLKNAEKLIVVFNDNKVYWQTNS